MSPASFFSNYATDQMVAGMTAGVASTLVMQPLDLAKVRLQTGFLKARKSAPRLLRGVVDLQQVLQEAVQSEGIRGLYRGTNINIIGNMSGWGSYFFLYSITKNQVAKYTGAPDTNSMTASDYFVASSSAGVISSVLTNPLWVVKTRAMTSASSSRDNAVLTMLRKIYAKEGLRGYFKGTLFAILGTSNGVIQITIYEKLKQWSGTSDGNFHFVKYLAMSGSSKFVALCIMYPFQTVRSRLQLDPSNTNHPSSIVNCVRRVRKEDGIGGFYRGLATNAIRILPGTCVTFVVYEYVSLKLQQWAQKRADSK